MLKYNIKLTDDNIKQEKLVWSEKYLAPDLSFVSGVTSQDYHLEKFNGLPIANPLVDNTNSSVLLETENVTREGYVIISGKTYDVNSGSVVDYSVESSGNVIDYNYLFLNGKYYYSYSGSEFTIDDWLSATTEGTISAVTVNVSGTSAVTIDTIAWIEDGIVNIDGHDYFFERGVDIDSATTGCLKYYEDGNCLDFSAITQCKGIEYHPCKSISGYSGVTKFILTKKNEIREPFDNISFCKRFFYAKYKDNYLPVREVIDTIDEKSVYSFKCDIPNYILGTNKTPNDDEYYKTVEYDVYGINDESSVIDQVPLSGIASPYTNAFDVLMDDTACIVIENEAFKISHDIMNTNDGKDIAIYLENDTSNMAVGDEIKFIDASSTNITKDVYLVGDYGFNKGSDTSFVIYNGMKYKVEDNICDKAIINKNEYPIDYINGKVEGKDCLVVIDDELVPMYISGVTNGEYSAGTLTRYGRIISGESSAATVATYSIKPYSGITIDGERYPLNEEYVSSSETRYYVNIDKSNEYTFTIEEIIGSSMVVCKPTINSTDFTDEFIGYISKFICQDVIDNQMNMVLYVKNKVFGEKEITKDLAFQVYERPLSSNDYFNLFDNFDIYTKNGYIHLPISLSAPQGNNTIQDDVVENEFFNEVKKRMINPIVDMEKDVYSPKYIANNEGKYSGSTTDFKPIKEIRINLHFRTRNLDNWKVNEWQNAELYSGNTDNWFITDFHPYKNMLSASAETLLNTSDLVGLLNFNDDDVYYQKSKIGKSFLRFSFYDSIDPQRQSLLATSCVFMDEHRLFKKFIDNSRKNVNDYGRIEEPVYKNGVDIASGKTFNKISVKTEYLGSRKTNGSKYIISDNQYVGFSGVTIDDEHRIGSEFIINNKYETDTSSEGYYIYIFREYSENLTPKPIYMKVEFNHAGIGKTIPFIIPMKWNDNVDKNSNKTPISALTLSGDDLVLLKQGVKLEDVYAQTYIPLYAVYDFKNKEYAYVFDSRYASQNKDDVIVLNLFELKINDEQTGTEEDRKDITYHKQKTAIIDVNLKQFNKVPKECTKNEEDTEDILTGTDDE